MLSSMYSDKPRYLSNPINILNPGGVWHCIPHANDHDYIIND